MMRETTARSTDGWTSISVQVTGAAGADGAEALTHRHGEAASIHISSGEHTLQTKRGWCSSIVGGGGPDRHPKGFAQGSVGGRDMGTCAYEFLPLARAMRSNLGTAHVSPSRADVWN